MARNRFAKGQLVEIRRDQDSHWEPATYDKPRPGGSGHLVDLPDGAPPRIIRIPLAGETGVRGFEVRWVCVPAKWIRARKETP